MFFEYSWGRGTTDEDVMKVLQKKGDCQEDILEAEGEIEEE